MDDTMNSVEDLRSDDRTSNSVERSKGTEEFMLTVDEFAELEATVQQFLDEEVPICTLDIDALNSRSEGEKVKKTSGLKRKFSEIEQTQPSSSYSYITKELLILVTNPTNLQQLVSGKETLINKSAYRVYFLCLIFLNRKKDEWFYQLVQAESLSEIGELLNQLQQYMATIMDQ
ncbi:hypothetical protein SSX86_001567 [Deinandra increscens subsp. villosa]|uniref:Uncharacterized protein n=1 Tax=Deinandra increscens subsp. villosa TaxID=3103831 RepID=A0AAP0DRW4_9ASTR